MRFDEYEADVIAPRFFEEPWSEAEVLGSTVWLWMSSDNHYELPLNTLNAALLPAIKSRQFVLASSAGQPIFFVSWAAMSLKAEKRYLDTHQLLMKREDWESGNRLWFIDWVAPFGHTKAMFNLMKNELFKMSYVRFLYHRSEERGRRIQHFFGASVPPRERKRLSQELDARS